MFTTSIPLHPNEAFIFLSTMFSLALQWFTSIRVTKILHNQVYSLYFYIAISNLHPTVNPRIERKFQNHINWPFNIQLKEMCIPQKNLNHVHGVERNSSRKLNWFWIQRLREWMQYITQNRNRRGSTNHLYSSPMPSCPKIPKNLTKHSSLRQKISPFVFFCISFFLFFFFSMNIQIH